MTIGLIGLGKMGQAIAYRLVQKNITVFGFDLNEDSLNKARKIGVTVVDSLQEMAEETSVFWLMVPVGSVVDRVIDELQNYIKKDAIIIDGGNSKFTDSIMRAEKLKKKNILFLDCGTSGGLHAKQIGFSLMIGGQESTYKKILPLFQIIAASNSCDYMGKSGSGHYVKMIHNAIEYGLLQAYAEGFNLLKHGHYKDLDLKKITKVWQKSSIIRSWILDLSSIIFEKNINIDSFDGKVAQGGTGRWAVEEANKQNIDLPVIKQSLQVRNKSQETGGNYATKLVALLRNQFGGHEVKKIKK